MQKKCTFTLECLLRDCGPTLITLASLRWCWWLQKRKHFYKTVKYCYISTFQAMYINLLEIVMFSRSFVISGMTKWLLAYILHQNTFWSTVLLYLYVVNFLYWIFRISFYWKSPDYKRHYNKTKTQSGKILGCRKDVVELTPTDKPCVFALRPALCITHVCLYSLMYTRLYLSSHHKTQYEWFSTHRYMHFPPMPEKASLRPSYWENVKARARVNNNLLQIFWGK